MKSSGSFACCLVDGGAVAGEAFEDVFGGLVPDERGRVVVPVVDPGSDVGGESFDAAVGGALQFLGGSAENHRSTRFSQDAPVGVKCSTNLGCAASQRWMAGVLWVA